MVGEWSSIGFSELAERLKLAVSWLRALGADVERARLGAYKRAMEELSAAHARGDRERLRQLFPLVANDLFEANEIATVYAAYSNGRHDEYVRGRLRGLASGPHRYVDEHESSSGSLPRNLVFELLVGARLIASGFDLEVASGADVTTIVDGQRIVFECKRPQTEKRVERRVMEARDQIAKRCQTNSQSTSIGVIALDLTKLTNPDFQLLVRVPRHDGTLLLAKYLEGFFRERAHLWVRASNGSVVGVLLRVSVLAQFSDETGLTYCQQYLLAQLQSARPLARITMRKLSEALGASAARDAEI